MTCGSNYLVKSTIIFAFRYEEAPCKTSGDKAAIKNYNFYSLLHENTKTLLLSQQRLVRKLMDITPSSFLKKNYGNIINNILKVAKETHGRRYQRRNKNLWKKEIKDMIKEKKDGYMKRMSTTELIKCGTNKVIKLNAGVQVWILACTFAIC